MTPELEKNPVPRKLSEFVKEKRLERGLKQKQLADLVGTNQSYIARIERGDLIPRSDRHIKALASALKVDVNGIASLVKTEREDRTKIRKSKTIRMVLLQNELVTTEIPQEILPPHLLRIFRKRYSTLLKKAKEQISESIDEAILMYQEPHTLDTRVSVSKIAFLGLPSPPKAFPQNEESLFINLIAVTWATLHALAKVKEVKPETIEFFLSKFTERAPLPYDLTKRLEDALISKIFG